MTKKGLSEADICAKYITPCLIQAGWDEATQIRREVTFTKGRIIVRGRLVTRGKAKRADYVLYYQHIPIAIIEAKDNAHTIADGMQQALDYAATLSVPFVFSSNGDGFLFHDKTGQSDPLEQILKPDQFPSPDQLWQQYRRWKHIDPQQEEIILEPYYDDGSGKEPRYYQRNAINATIEAIAKGQDLVFNCVN
jgi:type I restriction enzyme R subunit